MDLGIAGKTALVCAASKGLGRGCARGARARRRRRDDLSRAPPTLCGETAAAIGARTGRPVHWVACDITTAEGRARGARRLPASPTS